MVEFKLSTDATYMFGLQSTANKLKISRANHNYLIAVLQSFQVFLVVVHTVTLSSIISGK